MPKPRENTAHGRLTKKKSLTRARDVPLAEQHVESHEQIQIELTEIHASSEGL